MAKKVATPVDPLGSLSNCKHCGKQVIWVTLGMWSHRKSMKRECGG